MQYVDVLKMLINGGPRTETERNDALEVITKLDELNAFGTMAKHTEASSHECTPIRIWGGNGTIICRDCKKSMPEDVYKRVTVYPSWMEGIPDE